MEVLASDACDNCGEGQLGLRVSKTVVVVVRQTTSLRRDGAELVEVRTYLANAQSHADDAVDSHFDDIRLFFGSVLV